MKRMISILFLILCIFLGSCSNQEEQVSTNSTDDGMWENKTDVLKTEAEETQTKSKDEEKKTEASQTEENDKEASDPSFKTEEAGSEVIVNKENDKETAAYISGRLSELQSKWNPLNDNGEIAKLNNTRSGTHLSEETLELIKSCISLSQKNNGLIDITLYPLTRIWGFESNEPKVPQEILTSLLFSKCGMDTFSVSEGKVNLDKFTMLDVSAFSNGYSCDLIAKELAEKGCKQAIIDAGDHVRTVGDEDSGLWQVSLPDPEDGDGTFATLLVKGGYSVSSKGAFRRYFEENGKRYCDIFDPRNGKPVDNDLASVTVICKNGISADAYAYSCFVLGSEGAEKFYRENVEVDIILVMKNGEIRASEGVADAITLQDKDKEIKVIKK